MEKFSYALQTILIPSFCGIIYVKTCDVHRNKKCQFFHLCVFNKIYNVGGIFKVGFLYF